MQLPEAWNRLGWLGLRLSKDVNVSEPAIAFNGSMLLAALRLLSAVRGLLPAGCCCSPVFIGIARHSRRAQRSRGAQREQLAYSMLV